MGHGHSCTITIICLWLYALLAEPEQRESQASRALEIRRQINILPEWGTLLWVGGGPVVSGGLPPCRENFSCLGAAIS